MSRAAWTSRSSYSSGMPKMAHITIIGSWSANWLDEVGPALPAKSSTSRLLKRVTCRRMPRVSKRAMLSVTAPRSRSCSAPSAKTHTRLPGEERGERMVRRHAAVLEVAPPPRVAGELRGGARDLEVLAVAEHQPGRDVAVQQDRRHRAVFGAQLARTGPRVRLRLRAVQPAQSPGPCPWPCAGRRGGHRPGGRSGSCCEGGLAQWLQGAGGSCAWVPGRAAPRGRRRPRRVHLIGSA